MNFKKNYDKFIKENTDEKTDYEITYCFLLNIIFKKDTVISNFLIEVLQHFDLSSFDLESLVKQFKNLNVSNHYFDFSLKQKNKIKALINEKT